MSELKTYVEDHAADERLKLGFEEAMLDGLLGTDRAKHILGLQSVVLPAEFRLLSDGGTSVIGRRAQAYMVGRGFFLSRLYELGFGYCPDGPYAGRVIIPFYEFGKLVYWQARDFTGHVDPKDKIKNPTGGEHGKSDVLFNYDGVRELPRVVLTESWGSSLATGRQAFAINGKSMSEVQLHKILAMKADTIIILLDAGTWMESWIIAKRVAEHGRNVCVCDLPSGDPNEVLRHVLIQSIQRAQPYTAANHIRAVAKGAWGVTAEDPIRASEVS
jgi:hypothetical protein